MRFILFFFYVLIYVQMYVQYIYMQGLLNLILILRIYLFNEMFICGVFLHQKLLGIKIVISLIQFSQKVN